MLHSIAQTVALDDDASVHSCCTDAGDGWQVLEGAPAIPARTAADVELPCTIAQLQSAAHQVSTPPACSP